MDAFEAVKYFGSVEDVVNRNLVSENSISFEVDLEEIKPIWRLNTHSQTLLTELRPEEIILVEKR
ncbi:MAG: hypothetical protein ACKVOQ_10925 [Cyclobacteriaceae bacterium]